MKKPSSHLILALKKSQKVHTLKDQCWASLYPLELLYTFFFLSLSSSDCKGYYFDLQRGISDILHWTASVYLTGRLRALERLTASIVRRRGGVEWMTELGVFRCSLQILVEQKQACFTSRTCKSWLQRVSKGHRLVFVREKLDLLRKHSREDRGRGGVSLQASRVVFNMWTLSPWCKQNLNCS